MPFDYVLRIPTANVPMKPARKTCIPYGCRCPCGVWEANLLGKGSDGIATSVRSPTYSFANHTFVLDFTKTDTDGLNEDNDLDTL